MELKRERHREDDVSNRLNDHLERAYMQLTIPDEIKIKIDEVLKFRDTWEFDVFRLAELTNNNPLLILAQKIFQEENFLFEFKIPEDVFLGFVSAVEAGYRAENPYHNSIHAADVLHATYYFIKKAMKKDTLSSLEIMSALVAAMVHDYAHPGVNNNFLVKIDHPLALRYNDRAVLENYHVSESFKMLKTPELNILCGMTQSQISHFRSIVLELVLGTDVSHHFEYLSKFENKMQTGLTSEKIEKKEDILLVLTYVVKCADMSNSSRPAHLNRIWVDRVMSEFFDQGDLEKEKGLDISMFYDREKPNTPKCQTGFIDYLVRPMYTKWNNFTQSPATKVTMDLLEENYQFWKASLESSNSGQPQGSNANQPRPKSKYATVSQALTLSELNKISSEEVPLSNIRNE